MIACTNLPQALSHNLFSNSLSPEGTPQPATAQISRLPGAVLPSSSPGLGATQPPQAAVASPGQTPSCPPQAKRPQQGQVKLTMAQLMQLTQSAQVSPHLILLHCFSYMEAVLLLIIEEQPGFMFDVYIRT